MLTDNDVLELLVTVNHEVLTPFDELSAFFGQIGCNIIFIVNKLLESDEGKEASA